MKLLKWLSVTDRFYKIYLDKQLAPFGINNSQYMFLIKICRSPGILQDSLMDMFYVHPSNIVRAVAALEKQGVTEELKMQDQMEWVGRMNNIRACAEEIVVKKIVYA